jgi:Uncharacterised protein family (UPF0236)
MITLPLTLPDLPLSVEEMETTVHAWGLEAMRQAFVVAWQAQAAMRAPVPCPACHSSMQRRAGTKARHLETRFGPVVVRRQRLRCQQCERYFQPDDALLTPALGRGRCTPALCVLAAQCGASWPYQQAATALGMLRGMPIAPETIRQIVGRTGAAVARQYQREAVAACQPPASAPPPTQAPAQVDVALDGAWVHARDTLHGMEVKVGVVHTGSEHCGATRTRLTNRRYTATAQGIGAFGPRVTAAIAQCDGFAGEEQTLLGDGAAWIWRLGSEVLPEATSVLDRWHLRDARRRATRAAVPDKEERAPWRLRLEAALDEGKVMDALVILEELAMQHPHPRLEEFAGYLREHRTRIPDYAARRAAGKVIGSGVVEKGADVVVNRRMKGRRGMRWWRERAEGVVALRLALLNDEWACRVIARAA